MFNVQKAVWRMDKHNFGTISFRYLTEILSNSTSSMCLIMHAMGDVITLQL